jgi:hypothetical protein
MRPGAWHRQQDIPLDDRSVKACLEMFGASVLS